MTQSNFTFMLYDEYDQPVTDSSAALIKVHSSIDSPAQSSDYCHSASLDVFTACLVQGINIQLYENEQEAFNIIFEYASENYNNLSLSIPVTLRPCLPAEINQTNQYMPKLTSCIVCPPGTYSLHPSRSQCLKCPDFVKCPGGNKVAVYEGYHRYVTSEMTIEIHPCIYPERCVGGENNTCATGYSGERCDLCDTDVNWVPSSSDGCRKCGSKSLEILLFVASIVFSFAFEAFFVMTAIATHRRYSRLDEEYLVKYKRGIYIILLTCYSQIFTIIARLRLQNFNIEEFANY